MTIKEEADFATGGAEHKLMKSIMALILSQTTGTPSIQARLAVFIIAMMVAEIMAHGAVHVVACSEIMVELIMKDHLGMALDGRAYMLICGAEQLHGIRLFSAEQKLENQQALESQLRFTFILK